MNTGQNFPPKLKPKKNAAQAKGPKPTGKVVDHSTGHPRTPYAGTSRPQR